jgi:hypothetical protein
MMKTPRNSQLANHIRVAAFANRRTKELPIRDFVGRGTL